MKYFYYISKTKVEMLQAQVRKRRFSLASISSKLGFGAASVTVTAEREAATLITDTLSVVQSLKKAQTLVPSTRISELQPSTFYHDQGQWRSGLFKFDSMCEQPIVTYALWRTAGRSLILLVGSPNHILGDKVVAGECYVPGSSGAHIAILDYVDKYLAVDEPAAVRVGRANTYGMPAPVPEASNSPIIFPAGYKSRSESEQRLEKNNVLTFSTNERGLNLAYFCLKALAELDETRLDTVFRIFSEHDIPRENEPERFEASPYAHMDSHEVIREARESGVFDFDRVYLGSPVYTALE